MRPLITTGTLLALATGYAPHQRAGALPPWQSPSAYGGWTSQASGTTEDLYNVSCPGLATCDARAQSLGTRAILATTDGGATWRRTPLTTDHTIHTMACPDVRTCYVFDDTGTMLPPRRVAPRGSLAGTAAPV